MSEDEERQRHRPTHNLRVKYKTGMVKGNETEERQATVGVAWMRADGSFYIKLNPFVVLDARDNLTFGLFPNTKPTTKKDEPEE